MTPEEIGLTMLEWSQLYYGSFNPIPMKDDIFDLLDLYANNQHIDRVVWKEQRDHLLKIGYLQREDGAYPGSTFVTLSSTGRLAYEQERERRNLAR